MRQVYIWPELRPDQSDSSNVLLEVKNVYASPDTYRPIKAFSGVSTALGSEFKGGASFINSAGTATLLAGTANGLESLGSGTWTDKLTALSITGRWKFTQFGNYVICVNGSTTQEYNLTAGTASALSGAPVGIDTFVVGQFVVIAQPDLNRLKVEWCSVDDHTGWTIGTNSAGDNLFYEGGEVMGGIGGEYGVIFQRFAITRMNLTGDAEAPFSFDQLTNNYGCASKASIVSAGRTAFWLSDRGFMGIDDGQSIQPIGAEKIDRYFASRVPKEDYERIHAFVDPVNKLVGWGVPGTPGFIVLYNWELQRWTTTEFSFTGLMTGFTASETLEGVAATYTNIDTMPYSLDDSRFSGGSPRLYVVNGDRELGTLTGANLKATFKPALSEIIQGKRARFNAVWPDTDAVTGLGLTIDHRQRQGDGEVLTNAGDLRASGRMPVRCSGRFNRSIMTIEAGSVWSYCNGVELEYEQGSER